MISVTPRATTELRSLLTHSRAQSGHALRLALNGKGGINMHIGEAQASDTVVEDTVGPVLIVAAQLADRVKGLVFDWVITDVQGLTRGGFSFRPPLDDEPDSAPASTARLGTSPR